MNKKFFLVLGIGVIALGYMFNLGYAADDYGMVKNSLSLSIIAQSGSSGNGSGTGSGSTSEEEVEWTCSICGKGEDDCTCDASISCSDNCGEAGLCWKPNDDYNPETDPISKRCKISDVTYCSCNCSD